MLDLATGLIVHSHYVEQRARTAGYDGPALAHPAPGRGRSRPELRRPTSSGDPLIGCFGYLNMNKRIPQLLEAFAVLRRRRPGARLLLVGAAGERFDLERRLERLGLTDGVHARGLRARGAAVVADGGVRRARQPPLADDGRDVRLGDPGALARQAAARLGRRLVRRAARRRRAEGAGRRATRWRRSRRRSSSQPSTEASSATRARAYVEREHELPRVADAYVAALEAAAGGDAVADAVLSRIAEAAAEVGIDDARRSRARPSTPGSSRDGRRRARPRGARVGVARSHRRRIDRRPHRASARRIAAPWIMVDELIYSELAKSVASHGAVPRPRRAEQRLRIRLPGADRAGVPAFGGVPTAYAAAKITNAVVMSLAAVPAYYLARRILAPGLSLIVAALTVADPVDALHRHADDRERVLPAVRARDARARAHARATDAAAPGGVAGGLRRSASPPGRRRLRSSVRRSSPRSCTGGSSATCRNGSAGSPRCTGSLPSAACWRSLGTLARGRSPLSLLGAYRAATDQGYSVSDVAHYLLWHVAELDLYVGVVGFAALLAMWLAPRSTSAGARAFAAATFPITVLLVTEVAIVRVATVVSDRGAERLLRRAVRVDRDARARLARRRGAAARRAFVPAALAAGLLPVAIPFARFVNPSAVSDTLGLLPWWWLQDQGIHFGALRLVAMGASLVAAGAFVLLPRRAALVFPVLAALYFLLSSAVAENGRHGIRQASVGGLWAGIRMPHPDWIDRRVGSDANVSFLWHYTGETRPLWDNEFFNRSVGTVYTVDGPDPADGGLPETPVHESGDGTLRTAGGATPRVGYAVSYVDIAGTRLERDAQIGLALYRVDGPMIVLTRVRGLYPNDSWAGRNVVYRRVQCDGGHLAVKLGTDEKLFDRNQVVTAAEAGRVVASKQVGPAEQPVLTVPLHPDAHRVCTVHFTAEMLRVPAKVQSDSKDRRALGAHYYSFDYTR